MNFTLDWNEYKKRARALVASGCVLLKNDRQALPLHPGETVSVFGRIQLDYFEYKSGTGSGGLVNAPYAVSVTEGLENAGIKINKELLRLYEDFEKEHPFDKGIGWAKEPYCQTEMPLTEEIVRKAAGTSDAAIVIIGRSSGEDKDAAPEKGSYYLTDEERSMLSLVCSRFRRTAVLLNTGAIMDMSWVSEFDPAAVMYIWQGGSEGGNGVADVLTGKTSPSGKLADTIAKKLEDYPSIAHFGDPEENIYAEDIFVGYRYFETFDRDAVLYPFGFGLSYTSFDVRVTRFTANGKEIRVDAEVMNMGDCPGREVVQLYFCPPQGKLGKAGRNLVRFAKTRKLSPAEKQTVSLLFSVEEMASYDDGGVTGHKSAWVLEPGDYLIYCGTDVRSAKFAGSFSVPELKVTEQLEEALAPVKAFKRMSSNGSRPALEDAPLRTVDPTKRMLDERKDAEPCRGSQGLTLADVRDGKVKMDTFLSQLSDEDLICLSRGEGMCSPKVTAGIAGAFGGVTDSLKSFGIPVAGCSDGPSGIRMDSGAMAMSNPSGTLIACSFDTFAVAQLYEYQGKELRLNKIDMLLGPGMNIHRCPLNGRNFEYFSEDPYLTGTMASAELTAMHRSGVTGVIKHFACNNQEKGRNTANAVVSERALREIYLKGFEIAVKKGGAYAIMSTYGPVNGCWTAGNIDLCTVILRKQWHFSGIVMTDWSAMISDDQKEPDRKNVSAMIRAQNDIYMVNDDAASNSRGDDAEKALKSGKITRGDLLRNAKNILGVVMDSPAMEFFTGVKDETRQIDRPTIHGMNQIFQPDVSVGKEGAVDLDIEGFRTEAGSADIYAVHAGVPGDYTITMYVSSDLAENAQINMTLSSGGTVKGSFTLFGTGGKTVEKELPLDAYVTQDPFICFYFAQSGMKVDRITIEYAGERGFRPELERRKDKEK